MKTNIEWAPLIPLIGGMPIGAEMAFLKPPRAVYSYDGFYKNDEHYVHWLNTTRNLGIDYIPIDNVPSKCLNPIDVINGTPPCAALSQLNTGTTAESKGSGCQKNEWMYKVFEDGIDIFKAKVVIIENAPGLFTKMGDGVSSNLYEICRSRGYSLTLYKTSTKYHGIPQNRDRTFAIAWNSKTAPIMSFYNRHRKNFEEYLKEIPSKSSHQDVIINPKLYEDPYYHFLKASTNKEPRDLLKHSKVITTFNYVNKHNMLEDALKWFSETNDENGIKLAEHALKKFSMNKGIWDGSMHIFDDVMNAVIGRNMSDTIHPNEDRSLSVREALHMMGFPHDFELVGGRGRINHIAQNVPTFTSRDMHLEIGKFLNGELELSNSNFVRQNNHTQKTWYDHIGKTTSTIEEFFS